MTTPLANINKCPRQFSALIRPFQKVTDFLKDEESTDNYPQHFGSQHALPLFLRIRNKNKSFIQNRAVSFFLYHIPLSHLIGRKKQKEKHTSANVSRGYFPKISPALPHRLRCKLSTGVIWPEV